MEWRKVPYFCINFDLKIVFNKKFNTKPIENWRLDMENI